MIALVVLVTAVGVALGVLYPFISVILAGFGFSPGEIGLISSLGSVGSTAAVLVWGHLADVRLGRPLTLQVSAIGAAIAVGILLFGLPAAAIVVAFLLYWIFVSAFQPLSDALTVNAVRGRDYARVRTFTSLGFAVAAIAAGRIYDVTGLAAAFALFIAAAAVVVAAAAFVSDVGRADLARADVRVGEGGQAGRHARYRLSFGSSGVALRIAPRLGLVLLASALLHVGIVSGFTFLPLRLAELGAQPSDIALLAGPSAFIEIPAMLSMGGLAARFGVKRIFVASAFLYAAAFVSWAVLDATPSIIVTRALTGIAFSGVVVSMVLTVSLMLPRELQATGQSLFQVTAFGFGAMVANVAGGFLYQAFGHAAVFGVGAILAVTAAGVGLAAFPGRSSAATLRESMS